MKMYYLNNNGRAVRKFALKVNLQKDGEKKRSAAENETILNTALFVLKDWLFKANGEFMYEKKLSEMAVFCMVSFEDEVVLEAWSSSVESMIKDAKLLDVVSSKVLRIEEENGDDQKAQEKMERVKASLNGHRAAVLREKKIDHAKYELILFFTDINSMSDWEKTTFSDTQG